MKCFKRIVSIFLSAALLSEICCCAAFSASANDKSSIIFDLNGDKVSDKKDIEKVFEYRNKNIPVLHYMIYGDVSSTDYDTSEADSIPRYFLTNINQATASKIQKPLSDCWAYSSLGALESSVLKAKDRLESGDKIDAKAFGEPVLSGLKNEPDYSERAVAWLLGEPVSKSESLSQAGEGLKYNDSGKYRFINGGYGSYAETLFTAWRGVVSEKSVPHQPNGWNGSLNNLMAFNDSDWTLPASFTGKSSAGAPRVSDYLYLPPLTRFNNDKKEIKRGWAGNDKKAVSIIKQAVLDYGAVAASYDSSVDSISSTFYNGKTESVPDHAVLIVGWDDNFSKDNFSQDGKTAPNEDGAWLVKNSWGSYDCMKSLFKNWDKDREGINGMTYKETEEYAKKTNTTVADLKKKRANLENKYIYEFGIRDSKDRGTGFFWIYYCDRSLGSNYVYNVDIADDGYDYDNNYQYDFAMNNDDLRLSLRTADKDTLTGNVFTAEKDERLKAFSAYTNETDSLVKTDIYLLSGSEKNPTEGELVYTSSDKIKFAGFHTVKLNKEIPLSKGQKFAVVQNIKSYDTGTESEVAYLNLETGFDNDTMSSDAVERKVVCNEGETYVFLDGSWTTPKQLNQDPILSQVFTFGNAKIKAFTVNKPSVNAREKSMKAGERFKLKVKDARAKVKFSSEKSSVAKVSSDGTVTALKKGRTVISAALSDNTKLKCVIKVKNNPTVKINGKKFNKKKVYKAGLKKSLNVKILGKAKSFDNKYSVQGKNIKIIGGKTSSKIKLKALKKGNSTVIIKVNGVAFKIRIRIK